MAPRVDDQGVARAGSQLQTQRYVNQRTPALDAAIRDALPELTGATLDWRSPRAGEGYREYADAAFLKRLGLEEHASALTQFWAVRGGPHWDALARVMLPSEQGGAGVILVEGKSYPDEMLKGARLGATDPKSIATIREALAWTQGHIGIPVNVDAWTDELYQNANRIAHLCWLRSRGVQAWLVHLLFTGDPHRSTTVEEWKAAVRTADERLGIAEIDVDGAAHVILPAVTGEGVGAA